MMGQELRRHRCRILEIPPELRITIYELALHSTEPVLVTEAGYQRPALLSACHKFRKEALRIFHAQNKFTIETNDYSISNLVRFERDITRHPLLTSGRTTVSLVMETSRPHWAGVLGWLEWLHRSETATYLPSDFSDRDCSTMLVLHGMGLQVAMLKDLPWARVKVVVECQREVLIHEDVQWAL